ncbi:hypothetical protein [Enteractinococcus helveticum]|uniref:PknH-like extracellular domain-containing protein n=1 Tax=Enteractinococcus helveticum TaxID=1837282 RepID=A0A1B7M124_9MICC|nr:hypothetical protein [Enteractinococcus helveticum]OAV62116.1 hypothetical protein A6F49_07415 [Enteractinococcus helveticum]
MTISGSFLLRATAIGLTAGLLLAGCSSDDAESPNGGGGQSDLDVPEAPAETPQETALAETLETDFDVTQVMTMEEQWPDIYAMASALSGTEDPDLCQQAGAAQYTLLLDAQPASVRATFETDANLDEHSSGETVTMFYANDDASSAQLHEAYEHTDTSCVEEYENAIAHDVTSAEAGGRPVEVHTWQVVASNQLTGRMIDVVSNDIFLRYAAAYPPQVIADELEDDAEQQFNDAATQRALEIFTAAVAPAE